MSDNMVTFNGVQVPEADVLKAAAEIQQRAEQKPVEPGVYRWSDVTDAAPFAHGLNLRRKNADGSWSWAREWGAWMSCDVRDDAVLRGRIVPLQPVEGVEYEGGDVLKRRWRGVRWEYLDLKTGAWRPSSEGGIYWREGRLRPITPTPWVPTVGEWVQHKTHPWAKALKVTSVGACDVWCSDGWVLRENVRPATPDEITAAKRIELVDRLIVRSKADGGVWQYRVVGYGYWKKWSDSSCVMPNNLDLDHYDILDEYVVEGAGR